jgi:hypothetical protein
MTEAEKAWLACAIDGEGTIYVTDKVAKKTGWKVRRVVLCVCNTNLDFLTEAGRLLGNSNIELQKDKRKRSLGGHRANKDCYQVRQYDRFKAVAILKELLPYLIIKKDKALAGIQLVEDTDWTRRRSQDERDNLSNKMKALWADGSMKGCTGKRWSRKKAVAK